MDVVGPKRSVQPSNCGAFIPEASPFLRRNVTLNLLPAITFLGGMSVNVVSATVFCTNVANNTNVTNICRIIVYQLIDLILIIIIGQPGAAAHYH